MGGPLASLPPRTLSVQAMASALLEMQAVAMGRLDVGGAVVLIDDGVAAVLADSALLSVLLNGGAARVAALSDAKIGEAAQELVVLAGDLGEHVTRSLLALQAAGGHIRGIVLTAPSSRQRCAQGEVRLSGSAPPVPISWAPLCFAPLRCAPQPTMVLCGGSSGPSPSLCSTAAVTEEGGAREELGSLAYLASVMMEGLSGQQYSIFAVGSRARALATRVCEWSEAVHEACAIGAWRDDSSLGMVYTVRARTHAHLPAHAGTLAHAYTYTLQTNPPTYTRSYTHAAPAHLMILDGDADLASDAAESGSLPGALLEYMLSTLPAGPAPLPPCVGAPQIYGADVWGSLEEEPAEAGSAGGGGRDWLFFGDDAEVVDVLGKMSQADVVEGWQFLRARLEGGGEADAADESRAGQGAGIVDVGPLRRRLEQSVRGREQVRLHEYPSIYPCVN